MTLIVQAHLYSDDRLFDATFDTTKWFEQADDKDIVALARINFGGGPEADAVAYWAEAEGNRYVEVVLSYHRRTVETGSNIGCTTEIDPNAAMDWIEEHRPHLLDKLEDSE